MNLPEAIEIPASGTERGVLIAIHGRGSSPDDIAILVELLDLPDMRALIPKAPHQHPEGGGNTWYRRQYTDLSPEGREEFGASHALIQNLIEDVVSEGIPANRIAVLGFSQGGVLALESAICTRSPLACAVVLSGGLFDPDGLPDRMTEAATQTPILMIHGTEDSLLPIQSARIHARALADAGLNATYLEYHMDHQVIPEEYMRVRDFLESAFSKA